MQFNDAVLALRPTPKLQAIMWMGKGFAYAARGDWDSALVAMARWQRLTNDSTASLTAYGLAVAGAHLASVDRARAAAARPERARAWPEGRAELAWLDGIIAHTNGDAAGRFVATGIRPHIVERIEHFGLSLPPELFQRGVIR